MIKVDWTKIEWRLGLGHMVAVVVVTNLAVIDEPTWTVGGISALLAWVILLLGNPSSKKQAVVGVVSFFVCGAILSAIAHWLATVESYRLISVGVVAFLGSMLLVKGLFAFITGFCLVYWFLLSPIFSNGIGLGETLEGHLLGSGAILVVVAFQYLKSDKMETPPPVKEDAPSLKLVTAYAAVVASTMMLTFGLGMRFMKSDPTIISQAAYNVISPSTQQTWDGVIMRMIFGTSGICLGFYLGVYFPSPFVNQLVIAVSSFVALAFVRISFGPMVGAFMVIGAYPWGRMEEGIGNAIANEKILGEITGVLIAGVAISVLFATRKLLRPAK